MKTAVVYVACTLALLLQCSCTHQRKKPHYTDYEIYELIDTMHKYTAYKTFYTLLDVSPDSTPKEISSAFRKKSIEWHPDKSSHPNAKEMFPVVAAASKILQDQDDPEEGGKAHYDWLINEAPAWHRSAYYVRKIATAKLSLSQVCLLIFVFINMAQFIGMWCKFLADKIVIWDATRTLGQMAEKEFKKMKRKVETREVPVEKFENDDYYHAYALTLRPVHKPTIKELCAVSMFLSLYSLIFKRKQE